MQAMDYLLTDSYMDPPGAAWSLYSEQPVRLPDCWCAFYPMIQTAPAQNRNDGPICFGSLNNPCKHNEPILRLWAQILRAVADSRLLLLCTSPVQASNIKTILQSEGTQSERLEFIGRQSREDYLRMYDRIDICLDPLPYNGITTTCDALWMGVPVVSLAGTTAAGRAAGSILRTVGLPEFATDSEASFIETAVQLAGD